MENENKKCNWKKSLILLLFCQFTALRYVLLIELMSKMAHSYFEQALQIPLFPYLAVYEKFMMWENLGKFLVPSRVWSYSH